MILNKMYRYSGQLCRCAALVRNTTQSKLYKSTEANAIPHNENLPAGPSDLDPPDETSNDKDDLFFPKPFMMEQVQHYIAPHDIMNKLVDNPFYGDKDEWQPSWPGKAQFDPNRVPLDIRMGEKQYKIPTPSKFGNLELMKIENFLHLTPKAIKDHCNGLKQYCTKWPSGLISDEVVNTCYPVEYHTIDYVTAGQSQINHSARKIKLKINFYNLSLSKHAREKIIKLSKNRYDVKTDTLAIEGKKCPLRKQNKEYLDYLLTVLYFESWKMLDWETFENREEEDGIFDFGRSKAYETIVDRLKASPAYKDNDITDELFEKEPVLKNYKESVAAVKNTQNNPDADHDERMSALRLYKQNVKQLFIRE